MQQKGAPGVHTTTASTNPVGEFSHTYSFALVDVLLLPPPPCPLPLRPRFLPQTHHGPPLPAHTGAFIQTCCSNGLLRRVEMEWEERLTRFPGWSNGNGDTHAGHARPTRGACSGSWLVCPGPGRWPTRRDGRARRPGTHGAWDWRKRPQRQPWLGVFVFVFGFDSSGRYYIAPTSRCGGQFSTDRCGGQFFNGFFGTRDQATNLTSHSKSTKQPLNY
jgi:hypothetical protein